MNNDFIQRLGVDELRSLRDAVNSRLIAIGGVEKVRILSVPSGKEIAAIKCVRMIGGLGLKEAHDKVKNLPAELEVVNRDLYAEGVRELRALGCQVSES